MAEKPRDTFRFGPVRLLRDVELGSGSYGQVYKAMLGDLPCAAKLLHSALVDPKKPRNLANFEQECRFLSGIRHPNVVQFLGYSNDEESRLPVLLMELMDDSLTNFLEQSDEPLPYHVQVNISHDIALAISFLHLNHIVHRDLSSNNVLLIGPGNRAKVTDFGMSKLRHAMANLTKCPGTAVYMPPEALLDDPAYTEKLDCFQVGVLLLQIITQTFPDPSPAMTKARDASNSAKQIITLVPEIIRRQNHISLVPSKHPMLQVVKDCLKDVDANRPSSKQICFHLSALKEATKYEKNKQEKKEAEEDRNTDKKGEDETEKVATEMSAHLLQQLNETIEEKKKEVRERKEEVQGIRIENEALQRALKEKEGMVMARNRIIEILQGETDQLVTVKESLQRKVTEQNKIRSQLENELVPLREERTAILTENGQLREGSQPEKYAQLMRNYSFLTSRCIELQKSLTKESELSKKLEEANRELQQQLHEATNERNLQSIRERMERYRQERDQMKKQLQLAAEKYEKQAAESEETIADLQTALDNAAYSNQDPAEEWQREIESLTQKVEDCEARMRRYQEERNSAKIVNTLLQQQVATLQSTIDELQRSSSASGGKSQKNSSSSKAGKAGIVHEVSVKMRDGTVKMLVTKPTEKLNPRSRPAVVVKQSAGKYETETLVYCDVLEGKETAGVVLDCFSK